MEKLINILVARRVRQGGNAIDSMLLLSELIAAHKGDNLAHALHYNGFATEAAAAKAAEAFSA